MTAPADVPEWLRPVVALVSSSPSSGPGDPGPLEVPDGARSSAVLLLFGDRLSGDRGARAPDPPGDILLIERAHTMRRHAGQMAFPGGAVDSSDATAVAAAIREAREETGLDSSGIAVLGTLPQLYLPQRVPTAGPGFRVTPVVAWWRTPGEVHAADPAEVASVHRVPLDHLLDPANRLRVRHPSGYVGPAFRFDRLLVWGFTAGVLDGLLRAAGWERAWDAAQVEDLPAHLLRLSS